ncbi:NAD(P)/FAD-dependent oxidoreductase [Streptomyces sp. NPDC006632]|uniref:NAD(P)/FAD-dependent oxidoreductase n=1 Tax=Streptomyces sp. NPDC006632 TaxID=3157182 RepID=UPI0033AA0419
MTSTQADAVVVGAGLSGLACAADLTRAGMTVRLLEASDAVGGRVRTDRVDGFLLDRGFQVFNTSYPQVKRRFDLRGLRLRPFTPGALIHTPQGSRLFTDPTRRPRRTADLVPGRLASGRDLMALGLVSALDMLSPVRALKRGPERTTETALAAAGISPALIETFLRPFLSGVFLEEELETSSRFFHLVWRSMLRGTLCLPAEGIGAVPAQLAESLPPDCLVLDTAAQALTDKGVRTEDGGHWEAPTVVVATGAFAAARLLPGLEIPPTRTVSTYHHVAPASPLGEPTLVLDSRRRFLNTCVQSDVAPTYAPAGSALVCTSVLGESGVEREGEVRAALGEVYGTDTAGWDLLHVDTVHGALPAMIPPWPLTRTTRVAPGRYVCGDHRATGSVQGALASGTRAAREVLTAAGPGRSH